jgi:hypothetical protein
VGNKMNESKDCFLIFVLSITTLLFFVLFCISLNDLSNVHTEGVRRGVAEWYSDDGRMPTKWRYKDK